MNSPQRPLPVHAAMDQFPIVDGELHIGGMALGTLAERVGGTPFYAYDREVMASQIRALRQALPAEIHVHYAVKANPFPPLLAAMAQWVDGLDVASAGELRLALESGVAPAKISFAGPGKTSEELRTAMTAGVLINIESFREARELAALREATGETPRIAIRINPDFELKSSGMRMGGGPKPFGIDAEQVPDAMRLLAARGLPLEGFHLYAGSQNLNGESIAEALRQSFDLVSRLADHAKQPLRSINLGGGFGIPYFPGEQRLDLAPVAAALGTIARAAADRFPAAELVIELGRYLVGEAGVYVTRIVDKKVSRGHTFLVTDGGLNHHLAASGNFGQVLRKNYPVFIGHRMGTPVAEGAVSVVGPLCTPLDVLAENVRLPAAEPGDLVVVMQSGAYGASASPARFLGHPPPLEVLV